MEIYYLPIALQGVVMVFDELIFHRQRSLPKWERWGHPLDTLTLIGLILFIRWAPFTEGPKLFFIGWSIFSCLFVTKDEWVHKDKCNAGEHWVHALLFSLHPLTCLSLWKMWAKLADGEHYAIWVGVCLGVVAFLSYQVGYWNVVRKNS